MTRVLDILFSLFGLILLLPVFLVIAIIIVIDSHGGVFFRQQRVGRYGKDFGLFKFRTMRTGAEKQGDLTVGARDSRITKAGYFLRKYKLDELPQLINVLLGQMSLVGPRPEIRKYVDLYTSDQRKVLSVRPGVTDYASIEYSNENEILGRAADPEQAYIREVMPAKILLNMRYINSPTVGNYLKVIGMTIKKVLFGSK
jgi:lipopolysaccharide/colanic/teichoic acid biosynthesis glycosyltransferase